MANININEGSYQKKCMETLKENISLFNTVLPDFKNHYNLLVKAYNNYVHHFSPYYPRSKMTPEQIELATELSCRANEQIDIIIEKYKIIDVYMTKIIDCYKELIYPLRWTFNENIQEQKEIETFRDGLKNDPINTMNSSHSAKIIQEYQYLSQIEQTILEEIKRVRLDYDLMKKGGGLQHLFQL